MFRYVLATLALMLCLASPADAAVDAGALDGLIDRSLAGMMARQVESGAFEDPFGGGPKFNYGAVALAWLAGVRAEPGPAGDARRHAAVPTLLLGARVEAPGAFQTWLEALALTPARAAWLDPGARAALAAHLQAYSTPSVGPRALPCQRRARCYNNLKLVDAVAALQLVRTRLRSPLAGSRLADPTATEHAVRTFLARRVPAVQRPELSIAAGALRVADGAVLSDPIKNPLAYHALSTALLVRAVRMLGPRSPRAARVAARRALWALVGLADPRGTVAWMGRGQANTWTYAASTYAALAGAAEFADERALAARLRRLAELAFAELGERAAAWGLEVLPGHARSSLAGADRSQNTIVCNGLSLAFLHLAAAEARAAAGPTAPLPSEVAGSTVLDPVAAGVAAARGPRTWLAVHRVATHPTDARYDGGLLAANVLTGGGWVAVVGERPNTYEGPRAPSAGPLLVRGAAALRPSGRLAVAPGAIALRGAWRGPGGPVAATWRFTAQPDGAALRSPCPRGYRLRLVEWVPADVPVVRDAHGLALPGRTLRFSTPIQAHELVGQRASAAFERLIGVELETPCHGHPVTVEWRATAP